MQLPQRFLVLMVLIGSFVHAEDVAPIFDKPVISRITEAKIEESQQQFEAQFARATNIQRVLTYGVLPVAVACSTYFFRDKIYNISMKIGDTLVGTSQCLWSGACGAVRFISSPFTVSGVSEAASVVVDTVVEGADKTVEIVPSLTADEIAYVKTLRHSLLENTRLWLNTRPSYLTAFTAVLLNVLGKDYAEAQLSAVVGTQNLAHFIAGSMSIIQIRDDLRKRHKPLCEQTGRSAIEHMRERIPELSEKLQADVVRIIAFMQALNAYNDFEIGSISSQTRMLMDEANDMASLLEHKLDEFDHTADLEKRQELLKEMVQKILNFLALLGTELQSFAILTGQKDYFSTRNRIENSPLF